ncbi:MAG TPA: hypothetical protein VLH09_02235 [Bryobacteraceae bacterium]|nr:hypothetical protein [Bryobacteraceae bacterium]
MKDREELRPEKLDAHFDLLDLTGVDHPAVRLPLIAGVTYAPPRTIAQMLREDFGPEGTLPMVPPPRDLGPVTHLSIASAGP